MINRIKEKLPPGIRKLGGKIFRKSIRLYKTFIGAKRIVFLNWYGWVKVDLIEYLKKNMGRGYYVYRILRKEIESLAEYDSTGLAVENIRPENYEDFSYKGLYLWEICKSSVCDHLLKCSIENEDDLKIVKSYYQKTAALIAAYEIFFASEKPHAIVVEQGFQYDMRTAVEVARRMGIKTIAIENAFLKDYFFIDSLSGGICNRHFLARGAWDNIRCRELTDEQRDKIRKFFLSYSTQIEQGEKTSNEALKNRILKGENKNKKIVLLIGQVATDAAIVMDSHIYREMVDFIEDTAGIIKKFRSDYHLVVRLHPKEAFGQNHHRVLFNNKTLKTIRERGIDNLDYVTVFHSKEINTYQLMDIADMAVVITSQAGLEFLRLYKPTIVLGDAFYARKGFTFDVNDREFFPDMVEKVIKNPELSEKQKKDIDNFLYYMVFEYLFPKDLNGCKERVRSIFK